MQDKTLTVDSSNIEIIQTPQLSPTGDKKTAIILFNFQNDLSEPYTSEEINNTIFEGTNSTNFFYQKNSYNQISFSGDIFGWYTIPYDNNNCDSMWNTWFSAAYNKAIEDDVNLSDFDNLIYIIPNAPGCRFSGIAYIGGDYVLINGGSLSWITKVTNHELGHNLGLWHAASLNCYPKVIDDYRLCSTTIYEDPTDPMGNGLARHFNGGKAGFQQQRSKQ